MHTYKNRIFAVLCAVMLFPAAGCKKPAEEIPPDTADPRPQLITGLTADNGESAVSAGQEEKNPPDLSVIGGSLAFASEQNDLDLLLDIYDSVHVTLTSGDGVQDMTYLKWNGELAVLLGDGSEGFGSFGSFWFQEQDGRICAELDIPGYLSGAGDHRHAVIADCFALPGEITEIQEQESTLTVTVKDSTAYGNTGSIVYTLDKGLLRLIRAEVRDASGAAISTIAVDVNTGADAAFLSAWEETRDVTFICDRPSVGKGTERWSLTMPLPKTWEVIPRIGPGETLYLDEKKTMPYAYPGDGKSYTVYASLLP